MYLNQTNKGVIRKIVRCFTGVFSEFQEYVKEVYREYKRHFKGVLRKFQGCAQNGLRVI